MMSKHFSTGDLVQLGYITALWILNTVVLQILNYWKPAGDKKPNGYVLIGSNYALLLALLLAAVSMDTYFPTSNTYIGLALITMKANASSYTLALLDFYFSSVEYVNLRTIIGAFTWSMTACVSMGTLSSFFGGWDQMIRFQVSDFLNPASILFEYCRFVVLLLFSGLITDLVFSPMHRLTHSSRWLYTNLHARHHEFRSRLTSLVLFHGDELDDLFMAACPIVGFAGTMATWTALAQLLPPSLNSSGPYMSTLAWY